MIDTKQLEADVADLASVVQAPGWQRIIKPNLSALMVNLMNGLVFGGAKDRDGNAIPDAELKARIKNINWMLEWDARYTNWVQELEKLSVVNSEQPQDEDGVGTIHDPRATLVE